MIGLLPYDPVPWLLSANDAAITALVRRDLRGEKVEVRSLWELPEPKRLVRRQQENGSWRYPVQKPPWENYYLYETFTTGSGPGRIPTDLSPSRCAAESATSACRFGSDWRSPVRSCASRTANDKRVSHGGSRE